MDDRRVFKTRYFKRWMYKTELTDITLCQAVNEMQSGLIDADLGGGVVKKRVGVAGRGKRGGLRTLLATNRGSRWFFIYGFAKNEMPNVSSIERKALQRLASDLLLFEPRQLHKAILIGDLQEICHGTQHEN